MKVLITGATGLIGDEIVSLLLQNGISIHYLTTSKKKIENQPNYRGFFWNPEQGIIDENCLMGVDAIIHLAGATIAKRWTTAYKEEILESRILSSNVLFKALKNNPHQVQQIVSASASGIYPNSDTIVYTEDSPEFDDGFLGTVVVKWEDSVDAFKRLNVKVCILRTGLVFSNKGGALPEMMKPIQWGVGAPFGSGKQMQSWIHIHDLAALYLFAVENKLDGVYNAVAPNPVTNEELTKAIATVLRKPLLLPNIPQFVMKFILGDMHELLFENKKLSPQKVIDAGFLFKYKTLFKAFENLFP
ncbi:TIGR01777 family oxidoreductase [Flavobacterium sp. GT3R68]|uniref:TIGR01777 family oxidoreductase n=1 Tax=Flavobacterium sp. GT3R68 TaxID=2594437 RepID=UPI000F89329E|nr:TIGR01777 family oxidoreductase [Flavobacterium sp. GT3R68]RTY93427.1 TIGR01777 family protein [Flavobacterium sp. GSN2]TRW92400.1 TIGR01777 family protein [Flavobacterium sp. GT3R68]